MPILHADGFDGYVSIDALRDSFSWWAESASSGNRTIIVGRNNQQALRLEGTSSVSYATYFNRNTISVSDGEYLTQGFFIRTNRDFATDGYSVNARTAGFSTTMNSEGGNALVNMVIQSGYFFLNGNNTLIPRNLNQWHYVEIFMKPSSTGSGEIGIRVDGAFEYVIGATLSPGNYYCWLKRTNWLSGNYCDYDDFYVAKDLEKTYYGPLELTKVINPQIESEQGFLVNNAPTTIDGIFNVGDNKSITTSSTQAFSTIVAEVPLNTLGYTVSIAGSDSNISPYYLNFDQGDSILNLDQMLSFKIQSTQTTSLVKFADASAFTPNIVENSTDPDFYNVTLLINGNGLEGQQLIYDSSIYKKTITTVGNTKCVVANKKYGTSSLLFDGSGDYLSSGGSFDYAFAGGDFTIEAWVYRTTTSGDSTIIRHGLDGSAATAGSWELNLQSNNLIGFYWNYYTSSSWLISTTGITNNTWHHIAVVRSQGVLTIYLDGVPVGSVSNSTNLNYASGSLFIGGTPSGSFYTGNLDDIRITKGVARYTSDFSASLPLEHSYDREYRYFRYRVSE